MVFFYFVNIYKFISMNKDKKMQIAKAMARQILEVLAAEDCFDGFVTRFFTRTKCINYLQKNLNEYFYKRSQLLNWNKNTWFDIFDDTDLVESLVWYMQDFNLAKEKEEEEEVKIPKRKKPL